MTLHSAFHFKFGNDFSSLSDKLREELRSSLSKLKIVIVDEMSMVKSDLLYQLNLRLQEIKQNQDYFNKKILSFTLAGGGENNSHFLTSN